MSRGKLIALEGPDGCGKSTHAKLLAEWLVSEGYEVEVTVEPTEGPLGKILRSSLSGELAMPLEAEALLFAGDRSIHVNEVIRPAIEAGNIVITERYIHSSLAYQTARGLSSKWVKIINDSAINPDLAILIDVPVETLMERMNRSRELDSFEQDLELQRSVRERYQEMVKEGNLEAVDGTGEIDLTQAKIRKLVRENILETKS